MKKFIGWISASLFVVFQQLCGIAMAQTEVPPPVPAANTFECFFPGAPGPATYYTDPGTCETAFQNWTLFNSACLYTNFVTDYMYFNKQSSVNGTLDFKTYATSYVYDSLWHVSGGNPNVNPACGGVYYSGPTAVGFIDANAPAPSCQGNGTLDPNNGTCYCKFVTGSRVVVPMYWDGQECAPEGSPPVIIGPVASNPPSFFYQIDPPFTNSTHVFTASAISQNIVVTGTERIGDDGNRAYTLLSNAEIVDASTNALVAAGAHSTVVSLFGHNVDQWTINATLTAGHQYALLVSGSLQGVMPFTLYQVSADPQITATAPPAPSTGPVCGPVQPYAVVVNADGTKTVHNYWTCQVPDPAYWSHTYTIQFPSILTSTSNGTTLNFVGNAQAKVTGEHDCIGGRSGCSVRLITVDSASLTDPTGASVSITKKEIGTQAYPVDEWISTGTLSPDTLYSFSVSGTNNVPTSKAISDTLYIEATYQ